MWIVVLFRDQKFSIEVTGEETPQDIKNILTDVYGFNQKLSFSYESIPIHPRYDLSHLNEIPQIQGIDVVELRVIIQDKSMKDFPNVPPNIRQEDIVQMGLSTDTQTAYNESTSSVGRSSRSSSASKQLRANLNPPQSKSNSNSGSTDKQNQSRILQSKNLNAQTSTAQNTKANTAKTKQPPNTQTQSAQNAQTRPAQNTQARPAQNIQTRPAQNNQTRPAQNNQTRPAQNNQTRPAQNTQARPPPNTQTLPAQKSQANPAQNTQPNPNVQTLMEMGYTQKQAEDALRSSNNDLNAAANILINNGNIGTAAPVNNGSNNSNVQTLMEMGYTQKQAEDALRSSNNDLNAAANYLLNNSS